jgi:branched-chain amino acid transport system substrate-binding protein
VHGVCGDETVNVGLRLQHFYGCKCSGVKPLSSLILEEKIKMKLLRLFVLVAIVAVAAQGLGATTVRAQGGTIKIASHSPLSGPQSVLGTAIGNGTKLAIDQLSKNITDMGFKVEYVPFDDQATPDVGVANAQNIVNDAAILAVIGHLNSGVAIPSSEVYAKSDLVMVSPANTNPAVTDRESTHLIANRVCGRDDVQGPVGAKYAAETLGAKTVYIIHDKTAYGEGVATAFRDTIQELGVQVLGFEGTEEASNFDAVLTPIAAQNPDVIYYGGIYDKGGILIKQAREKGIKSQFLGADGLDSSDLPKLAGDAVIGTIFTTTAGPASLLPDAKQFIEDFKAAYKVENVETYAPEAYAATQIALAAIESVLKANGGKMPTRAEVAAAVRETTDFKTVIGTITFDDNGDPEVASYYTVKINSSDPALYGSTAKETLGIVTAPSPLAAKAMGDMEATEGAMMDATMEATP